MFQGISSILFVAVGLGLTIFLVRHDRGAKEPEGALWGAFGFGVLAIALTVIVQLPLILSGAPGYADDREMLAPGTMWLVTLFAASVEEVTKFVPLALYIRAKSYFNETTDGVIYFALSGLAFGTIENLRYVLTNGDGVGLWRTVLLLFFHPATTAIVGYYFARAKMRRESLVKTAWALVSVALVHAVYNYSFYLSAKVEPMVLVALAVTMLLNGGLFWYYQRAASLDESLGIAAVGTNRYCRRCGQANPKQMLYCEHCGQVA